MTEAPSNGSTSGDEAVTVRAEAIRAAAISAAPKHRRLLQSARGGRILSAITLRVFAIFTPPGHGCSRRPDERPASSAGTTFVRSGATTRCTS